jgi:hypothetical protein
MWLARLQLVQIRHADGVTQLMGDGGRVEEDGELEAVGLRSHLGHLVRQLAADTAKPDFALWTLKPRLP